MISQTSLSPVESPLQNVISFFQQALAKPGEVFFTDFLSIFPHFLSFGMISATKLHTGNLEGPTEWPAGPVVPTAAISPFQGTKETSD